jgi:hypothetical protein
MKRLGGLFVAVALVAGCASVQRPEGAPIADPGVIAGDWVGTMTPGREGVQDHFYLTITRAGTLTAAWGANTAWGTVSVANGRAIFQMHPPLYEGTVTLYESGGDRTLVLDDDWNAFNARVVPHR